MIVTPTARWSTLKESNPGDLVSIQYSNGRGLGIVANSKGNALIGFLETPDAPYPMFLDIGAKDTECINFGGEWVLALTMGDATYPGDETGRELPGAVRITSQGVGILFGRPPDSGARTPRHAFFNISNCEMMHRPESGATVMEWAIWASAADRDRADTTPLFSFKAPPPAA